MKIQLVITLLLEDEGYTSHKIQTRERYLISSDDEGTYSTVVSHPSPYFGYEPNSVKLRKLLKHSGTWRF